ncbi:MAG: signal peptidase I [Intrasporangium sp.]|uniref:signal peptidase I n=1 Tax=Intrasporangium sp. TaxID=1925024 RepID=UPI002647C43A|nr:signal peptidase I [Intrasporangium sp.]MDN5795008.1 signal peptidase I [Intrasporangium sp.]
MPSTLPPLDDGSGPSRDPRGGSRRDRRLRWLVVPAIVLIAIILVRAFLISPYAIPTGSMEPTLQVGDRILVSRLASPQDLERGDVIVFDASAAFHLDEGTPGLLRRVMDTVGSVVGEGADTDYVKRLIGLPGDRVRCCAVHGRITVNGAAVDEPYLYPGDAPSTTTFDVTLPADRYWVMGDHRSVSADSRSHLGAPGGGMIPGEDVIGQVWVRYWPPDRVGTLTPVPLSAIPRNGQ